MAERPKPQNCRRTFRAATQIIAKTRGYLAVEQSEANLSPVSAIPAIQEFTGNSLLFSNHAKARAARYRYLHANSLRGETANFLTAAGKSCAAAGTRGKRPGTARCLRADSCDAVQEMMMPRLTPRGLAIRFSPQELILCHTNSLGHCKGKRCSIVYAPKACVFISSSARATNSSLRASAKEQWRLGCRFTPSQIADLWSRGYA